LLNIGFQILRCAPHLFNSPVDKAEAHEISIYRKYNRLKDGELHAFMPAPQVMDVFDMQGGRLEGGLLGLGGASKPLVLISASVT
jgi:hypothetical protein